MGYPAPDGAGADVVIPGCAGPDEPPEAIRWNAANGNGHGSEPGPNPACAPVSRYLNPRDRAPAVLAGFYSPAPDGWIEPADDYLVRDGCLGGNGFLVPGDSPDPDGSAARRGQLAPGDCYRSLLRDFHWLRLRDCRNGLGRRDRRATGPAACGRDSLGPAGVSEGRACYRPECPGSGDPANVEVVGGAMEPRIL
ncbi:MAG: hypothetical protein JW937_06400 [Candidatus Omnitrophica bacterium]|nr:hypothetical protein [Candidatus Omnitrophota bacterium]